MISPIALTQELIRFNTINPPGETSRFARAISAPFWRRPGFETHYAELGAGRENLIACIGGGAGGLPLAFTGHVDVVPLGAVPWSVEPFGGAIADGMIYGRGSSDMKSGVAAFVSAAVKLAPKLGGTPGVVLVITAGEELGCLGAAQMRKQAAAAASGRPHRWRTDREPPAGRPQGLILARRHGQGRHRARFHARARRQRRLQGRPRGAGALRPRFFGRCASGPRQADAECRLAAWRD